MDGPWEVWRASKGFVAVRLPPGEQAAHVATADARALAGVLLEACAEDARPVPPPEPRRPPSIHDTEPCETREPRWQRQRP